MGSTCVKNVNDLQCYSCLSSSTGKTDKDLGVM
jgi:hypothetical protein